MSATAQTIGFVAGFFTTVAFVPQVLKGWRTRSVADLSFAMLIAFNLGVLCWIVYGLLLTSPPIVAANGVTLVLGLTLLGMKIRYAPPRESSPHT